MGFGAQASEPVVDEYLSENMAIMTEAGEHRVTVCEQVPDSGKLLPPGGEDAGAKCQKSLAEGRQDLKKQGRAAGGDMQKNGGPSLQRIFLWK